MPRFHCPLPLTAGAELDLPAGAARHVQVGDIIIIAAFASMSEEEANSFQPKLVFVDGGNKIQEERSTIPVQQDDR